MYPVDNFYLSPSLKEYHKEEINTTVDNLSFITDIKCQK